MGVLPDFREDDRISRLSGISPLVHMFPFFSAAENPRYCESLAIVFQPTPIKVPRAATISDDP